MKQQPTSFMLFESLFRAFVGNDSHTSTRQAQRRGAAAAVSHLMVPWSDGVDDELRLSRMLRQKKRSLLQQMDQHHEHM